MEDDIQYILAPYKDIWNELVSALYLQYKNDY